MDLEQEVQSLRNSLRRVGFIIQDMRFALGEMYAPKEGEPRPEVQMAFNMLASLDELPAQCPNAACRRAGMCQAEDVVEPPCIDLWPEELWERLGDMGAGIVLSALVAERRNAAIHERIAASNEAADQAMKVKGRSRGRRKN